MVSRMVSVEIARATATDPNASFGTHRTVATGLIPDTIANLPHSKPSTSSGRTNFTLQPASLKCGGDSVQARAHLGSSGDIGWTPTLVCHAARTFERGAIEGYAQDAVL